jgi:hypothetical protein
VQITYRVAARACPVLPKAGSQAAASAVRTALASILMPWKWLFSQITVAVLISWPGQAAGGTA